ncbi:MAG TPA: hypothetical protein VFZ27_16935 [Terriglobia bacterium]|nr:hypothetical protein [Terriglobia bacterium]
MGRWSTTSSSATGRSLRADVGYSAARVGRKRFSGLIILIAFALLIPFALKAESIAVRHLEGISYGFLVLKTADGRVIAYGDQAQDLHGSRVESRLTFRFKDGSFYQETVEFSERRQFRLLKDHVVQKGPSFKHSIESSIDVPSGTVSVRYKDADGQEKSLKKHLSLPSDLANGIATTLLKDLPPGKAGTTVSYLAVTPEPQLVKLVMTAAGTESFSFGRHTFKTIRYILKIDIGGVKGAMAKVIGKQPPDRHCWILAGQHPAFIKYEGQFEQGGPTWTIELNSLLHAGELQSHVGKK